MKNATVVLVSMLGFSLADVAMAQQSPSNPASMVGTADQSGDLVLTERAKRYIVIQRPDGPPIIMGGAENAFARNDLVGLWNVIHLEQNGDSDPGLASTLQMQFSRGKLELMQLGRPTITVAYRLDTKFYPRHFMWCIRPGGCIQMQRGVYWLADDKLLLCVGPVNGRRATEFLTEPQDGRTFFVLQRAESGG
jgi:uncharacterized protein (TIGR03067 family)